VWEDGRVNPIREVRDRARDFLTNLDAGPPWPGKAGTLIRNRARALRHGCCGNPGQPGC
jgi:hypothetical protein